jgi:tRNA nucleotidyltransferase (CCA-adding enzyme)
MKIPKNAVKILDKLTENGFEAYVVGGCVRDYIIGKEPKDWDITTSALPENIKKIFPHTVDTGIKHGTVTVIINRQSYEVTTYRIDGKYTDCRHPEEVTFTEDIKEDLSRRDFTMNAIAYNPDYGFQDPFNGRSDIEKRIIRGVGNAEMRFKEDALRMLRAVRFSAQTGFDIEEKTFDAVRRNADLIKNISMERIKDETLKLICSDNLEKMFLLKESGLYEYFFPELGEIINDFTIKVLKNLPPDKILRLCAVTSSLGEKRTFELLKSLKLDNKTINETTAVIKRINDELTADRHKTRILMSEVGEQTARNIVAVRFAQEIAKGNLAKAKDIENVYDEIDEVIRKKQCYNMKMLAINGKDIQNAGIKDGKLTGECLKNALEYVLEYPEKNDRDTLMELTKKIICNKDK